MSHETDSRFSISVVTILLVLSVALFGGTSYVIAFHGTDEPVYEYSLKVQQSFDNSKITDEDVIQMDDISETEHRALYEAFKETDHFLSDGTEAHVELDEPSELLDTGEIQTFVPVESNGIIIVVAIEHTATSSNIVSAPGGVYTAAGFLIGFITSFSLTLVRLVMFIDRMKGPTIDIGDRR